MRILRIGSTSLVPLCVLIIAMFGATPVRAFCEYPLQCDDRNPCTWDHCEEARDLCTHGPNPAGTACTDPCRTGGACDGSGRCLGGVSTVCVDGDPCTTDHCEPLSGGCVFLPDACDDGDPCTVDSCSAGNCSYRPASCDDGNPCTDDSCVPSVGCANDPNDNNSCDDGDPCTGPESCRWGSCVPCGEALGTCEMHVARFSNPARLDIPVSPGVAATQVTVSGVDPHLERLRIQTFLHLDADLDPVQMTIQSPAGTVVTLTTGNGSTGPELDSLYGTWWEDGADPGNPIPFPAGRFAASNLVTDTAFDSTPKPFLAPQEPFAAFLGEDPNGTWTLSLTSGPDALGFLSGWTMEVTTFPDPAEINTWSWSSDWVLIPFLGDGVPVSATVHTYNLPGTVGTVEVYPGLQFDQSSALEMTLTSPSGRVATVSNHREFDGNVWWTDNADPGNQLPFPLGPFEESNLVSTAVWSVPHDRVTPEEPLGSFAGENPNGDWTLTVRSTEPWSQGVLQYVSLGFDLVGCPVACTVSDADGDGICGGADSCPDSIMTETVVIGSCDTDVPNAFLSAPLAVNFNPGKGMPTITSLGGNGCTISDVVVLCDDVTSRASKWKECVEVATKAMKDQQHLLTEKQRSKIARCVERTIKESPALPLQTVTSSPAVQER